MSDDDIDCPKCAASKFPCDDHYLMDDGLKPCPFCGGEAVRESITEGENAGADYIACKQCWASSHLEFGRKENLVSSWNRRA